VSRNRKLQEQEIFSTPIPLLDGAVVPNYNIAQFRKMSTVRNGGFNRSSQRFGE